MTEPLPTLPLPGLGARKPDAHKGDFGRCLLIGGSRGIDLDAICKDICSLTQEGQQIVLVQHLWDRSLSLRSAFRH